MSETISTGPSVLVVGGGTAGHIEPPWRWGEAVTALDPPPASPQWGPRAVSETEIVPRRGSLELVTRSRRRAASTATCSGCPAADPRRPGRPRDAPPDRGRRRGGLRRYACVPVYLAAGPGRSRPTGADRGARGQRACRDRQQARRQVCRRDARRRDRVGAGRPRGGQPVKRAVAPSDRAALRAPRHGRCSARPGRPTVLVVGGSQGARSLNSAMSAVAEEFSLAGVGVLHAVGPERRRRAHGLR